MLPYSLYLGFMWLMKILVALVILGIPLSSRSQNVNVSSGLIFDGEPYLAINPNNGNHMVVAWMGFQFGQNIVIRTKVTVDGGQTWSSASNIPHLASGHTSADPSVQFDHNGNVYLCFVDYDPAGASAGTVEVVKSTDGGLTWGSPSEVISIADDPGKLCIDRPWMVIDTTTGPHQGNIYVTTMNAKLMPVSPPYNPYFIRSTDGGITFSTPRYLDSANYMAGPWIIQPMPFPAVGADGKLYASYPSYETSQSLLPQIFVASSNDAGTGFSYSTMYSGADAVSDSLAKKAGPLLCDPSDAGHLVHLGLLDQHGDADIFMMESFDEALTWSSTIRINDDAIGNGKLQDMVWGGFDLDGDLAVCWRDRRNGGSGYETDTEIWCAIRCRDSANFGANFSITDVQIAHDTVLNGSGNDAMCLQFLNDTLSAVWGDVRNGRINIYFNRTTKGEALAVTEIISEGSPELLYPNPGNGTIHFKEFDTPFSYTIIDLNGKVVLQGNSPTPSIDTKLESGQYFIMTEYDGRKQYFRFIVQQ